MNPLELAQKFKELARIILEKVEKSPIKKADFQLESYKVFVPDLRTMHFTNGKVEYFLETIEKQKHDIDFEVKVPKFYNKFCVKLTEFNELKINLVEFLGIKEEHAGNLIKNFIYHLIHKSNRSLYDNNLNHIVNKHIRNLNYIIRRAYNVRSKYSHGVVTNVKHEELEKLSRSVLQCARISLLFFLQIDSSLKKKKDIVPLNKKEYGGVNEKMETKARKHFFIKILDNTLIDGRNYEELQKFIQKRFHIFL